MSDVKTYSIPVRNFTIENEDKKSQFLKTKFFAIADGENLNRSSFEINGIEECKDSEDYALKPILGAFDKDKVQQDGMGNFGGHDSDLEYDTMSGELYNTYLGEKSERPLGLILPNTAKIESYKGKQWLTFEGLIWAEYNREAVRLLKKRRSNNVSVEIRVLDSYVDDNEIEVIRKFTLLGITIIGVDAGIPNACLNVLDFAKTPQFDRFVRAFSSEINKTGDVKMEFLKQDKFGTGETLKLDLSKDSASNDNWGSISKSKLRNDLLRAKNYKSLIPKSYLVVEEGWEDAPSEKLKYPIVQIKDGKVVLNINGVQAAGAYLMKEKDASYFRNAKAKLNRIRVMLGMEKLFGVETDDDWGELVSQNQPNIIKMEEIAKMDKKELVTKLSALFADKAELEKVKVELAEAYEDKLGKYTYAEDEDIEVCEKEMAEAKESLEKKEMEIINCEKSIMEVSKTLAELPSDDDDDDDDEEEDDSKKAKIDDEEEEYPVDTEGEDKYVKALAAINGRYISNSKSYIVFIKDGETYACKYECGEDGEIKLAENIEKCEKIYTRFVTGGTFDKDDMLEIPVVSVEITKGMTKVYADMKAKDEKMAEIEKDRDEKLSAEKENAEKFKKDVVDYLAKFDEIVGKESISKEYKDEIYSKIFNSEFKDKEEMETQILAKLYKSSRQNFLSGNYVAAYKAPTDYKNDKVKEIVNKYKNKGEKNNG